MSIVKCSLNIINCRIWHTASFEDLQPFLGGLLFCRALNQAIDLLPMTDSVLVCDETGICFPFRES